MLRRELPRKQESFEGRGDSDKRRHQRLRQESRDGRGLPHGEHEEERQQAKRAVTQRHVMAVLLMPSRAASTSSLTLRQMRSFNVDERGIGVEFIAVDHVEVALDHFLDPPRARGHDDDTGAERDRFFDVVRDEQHRPGVALPDAPHLVLEDAPRLGVQRAERLVHEQHLRFARERLRERDALLHAAGQLTRIAVLEPFQMDEPHVIVDDAVAFLPRPSPALRARTRCCRATVSQGNSE